MSTTQVEPTEQRVACTEVRRSEIQDIPWIVVNPIKPSFLLDQSREAAVAPREPSFFVVSKPRRGGSLLQKPSPTFLMAAFALRTNSEVFGPAKTDTHKNQNPDPARGAARTLSGRDATSSEARPRFDVKVSARHASL